ncbi:head GIN domain-containing protein [Carboxylicivirga sp. M1479]|uniref:head GIN domain-containing protein n=1 Tax=Carboxylicivirga sp. M1479 TaxID=2594476 RepID=UPI00163D4FC8|nr:head GIN domain-containing protein [Carboxylicivirga sp. M1479]
MKLTSTIVLLFAIVLSSFAQEPDHTQIRKVGSFDKIKASKGINVTLIEGDKEEIDVHIKNGEVTDVITEVKNRKLTVKMKTKIYKDVHVQVYVTYKRLRDIEAGSGATIDADNTIYAESLKLRAGTDANLLLDVDVNNLEVKGSTCKIELEGKTKFQEVNIGTGGKYLGFNLESDEAYAKSTLGSIVEVSVNNKLSGTAGSGGMIYYLGDPAKLEKSENTGGKVKKENQTT